MITELLVLYLLFSEGNGGNKTMKTFLAREVLPLAGHKDYFKNHSSSFGEVMQM